MGNTNCCGEKNIDVVEYDTEFEGLTPEKIIETNIKVMERIHEKLFLRKGSFIDKNYLINLSNIPEIIEIINKNIKIKDKDSDIEEIKKDLKNKIDLILNEIEEKIENISNEINNLNEFESKEREVTNKFLEDCEPYKKRAFNYIDKINNEDIESLINKKKSSKNEYLIIRLIFLIINPEENAQIPGLIIKKDIEIMKQIDFDKNVKNIKQNIINRLNNLSKVNSEIFEYNKIFLDYPFDNINKMKLISEFYENLIDFFENFINCIKSYCLYEPFFKKLKEIKNNKESLIKKINRLKRIKEQIILLI